MKLLPLFLCWLLVFSSVPQLAKAQLPWNLKNGISNQPSCTKCQELIAQKPPEVLFGIFIEDNGDVYFSMDNKEWFNKIFSSAACGVAVDIVSKDKYQCGIRNVTANDLIKGELIKPVYKQALTEGNEEPAPGTVYTKIGKVPANLLGKQLEGNLLILNGSMICYYTNFVNINRDVWQLLPMGLFTDTLVRTAAMAVTDSSQVQFTYSKKLQFNIPFQKNKTTYSKEDIKPLYDSLQLKDYTIKKIEIRAYASVEGSLKINEQLMKGRAQSLINALKQFQPSMANTNVINAENWIEFFKDIESTTYSSFGALSKSSIKEKLADKLLSANMEPLLSKERKGLVTLYLEKNTHLKTTATTIVASFNKAIVQKDIALARLIQKELMNEIAGHKIPADYINKLETPATKEFATLASDRQVYRYLLKTTTEYEVLQQLLELKKLDPDNGKINYG